MGKVSAFSTLSKRVLLFISIGYSVANDDLKKYNSPMKLVNENEYGAYLGVNAEFLQEFTPQERNPNFEVFDSKDNNKRFIAVKSSRLPDDQDIAAGRYGVDFNRGKPELNEALKYGAELPHALERLEWLANVAFAASTKEEYDRKASIWESFYSYIWGLTPKTVWVAPHSGYITRLPDDILPYPKDEMDSFTAGVAALCAFNDRNETSKRIMISIHGFGYLAAILDLGGFGIVDEEKLASVIRNIETKYHERVQILAEEYKQDFYIRATRGLEFIKNKRGTLDPGESNLISTTAGHRVGFIIKGLKLYGQEIKLFTPDEFKKALNSLDKVEVQVISSNYLFPGRKVSKLLGLSEKIGNGLLQSALQIECSRLYLAKEPELIKDIILDIKKELFE